LKVGSKTLAIITVVLVVVIAVFILDTTSLLDLILERLSLREPEKTYKAVLIVDGRVDEANSQEGHYGITYSVSNVGNTTAENVTLTTTFDGETQERVIPLLSVSNRANCSRIVQVTSNELHLVQVQASCADSVNFYSFSFGADVPRTFSDKPEPVKLFVTPREPSVVSLKDELLKESLLNLKD